jgi:Protein of unknown function with PCYCGC motif
MVRFSSRYGAGIATIVLVASASGCQAEPPAASNTPEPQRPAATTTIVQAARAQEAIPFTPPPAAYTGELAPLPVSFYAPARPMEVVRAVYTFAARHPEVLHYVPCFCGCQNSGHKDNDDCFIQSRDASGRPTWEPHGMT